MSELLLAAGVLVAVMFYMKKTRPHGVNRHTGLSSDDPGRLDGLTGPANFETKGQTTQISSPPEFKTTAFPSNITLVPY